MPLLKETIGAEAEILALGPVSVREATATSHLRQSISYMCCTARSTIRAEQDQ